MFSYVMSDSHYVIAIKMNVNCVTIIKSLSYLLCATIMNISHSYCMILMISIFDLHSVTSIESLIDLNRVIANKTKIDTHSPTTNAMA